MPSFPSFRQSAHQGPELSIRSHVSPKTRPSTNDTTTYASPYDSPHLSSATATDGVEAKALALTKTLHWVRIGLATLTLA
ncbi:MAG: hypothetical protein M1830_006384, partial [Pleopsidium flavum]